MTVIPITKEVTSAELAKVVEVTEMRRFEVTNDNDQKPTVCVYNARHDTVYCAMHDEHDNCAHTARVRLSGILTNTVTKKAGIARVEAR